MEDIGEAPQPGIELPAVTDGQSGRVGNGDRECDGVAHCHGLALGMLNDLRRRQHG